MSVSGRAGAGGGGPHQGALPQTVEAMVLYGLGLGQTDPWQAFLCCPKVLQFSLPSEVEQGLQTIHKWVLQMMRSAFNLRNEQMTTSSFA